MPVLSNQASWRSRQRSQGVPPLCLFQSCVLSSTPNQSCASFSPTGKILGFWWCVFMAVYLNDLGSTQPNTSCCNCARYQQLIWPPTLASGFWRPFAPWKPLSSKTLWNLMSMLFDRIIMFSVCSEAVSQILGFKGIWFEAGAQRISKALRPFVEKFLEQIRSDQAGWFRLNSNCIGCMCLVKRWEPQGLRVFKCIYIYIYVYLLWILIYLQ